MTEQPSQVYLRNQAPIKPRPEWAEVRIEMARALSKRSLCDRDQVGAVITDIDGKIIGEGYNGPAKLFEHQGQGCYNWCARAMTLGGPRDSVFSDTPTNYDSCPALHAEANALMMSDRSLRVGGIIFVTSHPCMGCAKLISNSGLTGVYVGHDGTHEYRRDSKVYSYLMNLGMRVWETFHEPRP